jgi:cell division GTPase FtsZ
MDPEANVIWGARIDPKMQGKIRVMTIIAGVKSPYVIGKPTYSAAKSSEFNQELGIDILR